VTFRKSPAVASGTSLAADFDPLIGLGTAQSPQGAAWFSRIALFAAANKDPIPLVVEVGAPVYELKIR
jgi:hypothetical protein